MTAKYPSIAFTARDVAELLVELTKYATNIDAHVRLVAKGNDHHRLEVVASCRRRVVCLAQSEWIRATVALSGSSHNSLDQSVHAALWQLHDELTDEGLYGGRYTELIPGLRPR